MKGKVFVSWSLALIPILITLFYGIYRGCDQPLNVVIVGGLIGTFFKAVFDFLFKLPMRVGRSGTISNEPKNFVERLSLLFLSLAMGIIGFLMFWEILKYGCKN